MTPADHLRRARPSRAPNRAKAGHGRLGDDRRRLARHVAEHGPSPDGYATAAALGFTQERFWRLVQCHWWEITGRGWALTAAGRREALGQAAGEGIPGGNRTGGRRE